MSSTPDIKTVYFCAASAVQANHEALAFAFGEARANPAFALLAMAGWFDENSGYFVAVTFSETGPESAGAAA